MSVKIQFLLMCILSWRKSEYLSIPEKKGTQLLRDLVSIIFQE